MKVAEEQSRKALADVARLTEELRHEQDRANQSEKSRKSLENQLREVQAHLEEAESMAHKGMCANKLM